MDPAVRALAALVADFGEQTMVAIQRSNATNGDVLEEPRASLAKIRDIADGTEA